MGNHVSFWYLLTPCVSRSKKTVTLGIRTVPVVTGGRLCDEQVFAMAQMISRKYILLLTLMAIPLLAGSQCAFFFSSGGGSSDSDDDDDRSGLVVKVSDGQFIDAPVQGVGYTSGELSGVTGDNGEFQYEDGNTVQFFIGDINLGDAAIGKAVITPMDLVEDGAIDTTAVLNIARLLQSLDSDPDDEVITIPARVRAAAVKSNEGLSSAVEFLDFADEQAFANAASQLVAVLTHDYPFTAVLVEPEKARAHMVRSIKKVSDQQ